MIEKTNYGIQSLGKKFVIGFKIASNQYRIQEKETNTQISFFLTSFQIEGGRGEKF